MRSITAILLVFALTVTARAEFGQPSQRVLNDMGLAGMQTLTDAEGLAIRGQGGIRVLPSPERLAAFRKSITEFEQRVSDFNTRLSERVSPGASRFADRRAQFVSNVAKFQAKIRP